jgi:S-DNA-T family DNA segregation ATPase FtsK/SpoIIIE
LEPVTALALRRFLMAHTVVPDLPVALSLQETATIWLEPDGDAARALARAVVAQFVLWHSPADARVAVVAAPSVLAAWEWAKWLPHNSHPRLRDGAGPLRMFTPEVDELRRWWSDEAAGPHLLVVVDGVADGMGPWAAAPCVTVLRVGAPAGRRPTPSVVRLRLTGEGVERVLDGEPPVAIGVPDRLATAQAAALARRLARYRPAGISAEAAARAAPGLPGLVGLRPGLRESARCARDGRRRGRPAARAHRRRRARGSGTARPQGIRPGRQRAARALHRGHRFREERAAAHRSSVGLAATHAPEA